MSGCFDEGLIESIRNSEASDSELVNEHRMNGAFVLRAGVTPHQELSRRDEDHFGFDDHRAMSNAGQSFPFGLPATSG